MGFSHRRKHEIIMGLRKLRRVKRNAGEKLTFRDIEELIWNLPPSLVERVNVRISEWQGKKNGK